MSVVSLIARNLARMLDREKPLYDFILSAVQSHMPDAAPRLLFAERIAVEAGLDAQPTLLPILNAALTLPKPEFIAQQLVNLFNRYGMFVDVKRPLRIANDIAHYLQLQAIPPYDNYQAD